MGENSNSIATANQRPLVEKIATLEQRLLGVVGASETSRRLYLLCVICQAITILVTWPLWQVRTHPPHLPVIEVPQVPYGFLLLISLIFAWFKPREGLAVHSLVLLVATLADQMRAQPQFLAMVILMAACINPFARDVTRWFFVCLWLWSGLHKLVSSDWFGPRAWELLYSSGLPANDWYIGFALKIAAFEIILGVMAIVLPRWASWLGIAMHFGIIVFLSPLFRNWNYSVFAWNFASAIVGFWVMQMAARKRTDVNRWEYFWAAALLIYPVGFYWGVVDHGYANVLYSGKIPSGLITTKDGTQVIRGWGELAVPFPNERRLLRAYFARTASPGDKLHISDPRELLDDQYFVMRSDGEVASISIQEFMDSSAEEVEGVLLDDDRDVLALLLRGVRVVKKSPTSMAHAVEFTTETYHSDLLRHLKGLPNLEQVQLSGTTVKDEDLAQFVECKKLKAIGLDRTTISDRGLEHLKSLHRLEFIQCEESNVTSEGLQKLSDYFRSLR